MVLSILELGTVMVIVTNFANFCDDDSGDNGDDDNDDGNNAGNKVLHDPHVMRMRAWRRALWET